MDATSEKQSNKNKDTPTDSMKENVNQFLCVNVIQLLFSFKKLFAPAFKMFI